MNRTHTGSEKAFIIVSSLGSLKVKNKYTYSDDKNLSLYKNTC